MATLANTFDRLDPHLPTALAAPPARARLRSVMDWLPACLSDWFYFECRLAERADAVDLVVLITEASRSILAGTHPHIALDERLQSHPVWARLARFYREWETPGTRLHQAVHHTWLEFDVSAAADDPQAVPVPGLFVCWGEAPSPTFTLERCRKDVGLALGRLVEGTLAPALEQSLDRALFSLPSSVRVPYFGLMFQRTSPGVRLCFADMREEEVVPYLEAAGWTGDTAALDRLFADVSRVRGPESRDGRFVMLHVDVGAEGLRPRVGVEFGLSRIPQLSGTPPQHAVLDLVTERGLCTPAKGRALREWMGYSVETLDHEIWLSVLLRMVNHVKIVCGPGVDDLEAKGYLFVVHAPRRFFRDGVNQGLAAAVRL